MDRLNGTQQVKFVDSVVSRYGVGLKEAAFTVGDGLYVMTKRATDKQVLQRHFVRQDMLRKYEETRNSDGGASAYDQETKKREVGKPMDDGDAKVQFDSQYSTIMELVRDEKPGIGFTTVVITDMT